MKKIDDIIGLPVINKKSGKKLGIIKDIVYNPSIQRVYGVMVQKQGIFVQNVIIPLKYIGVFGDVSVIVEKDTPLLREKISKEKINALEEYSEALGIRVVSKDGEEIGVISDFIMDEKTGALEAFEISRGFFDDLWKGRILIKNSGNIMFRNKIFVIPDEHIQTPKKQD